MGQQYMVVVSTSPDLMLGVLFYYQLGKMREGKFVIFCHKEEGIDLIAELYSWFENADWQVFVDHIQNSALPNFRAQCDSKKHVMTDPLKEFISVELMPHCIN